MLQKKKKRIKDFFKKGSESDYIVSEVFLKNL